MAITAEEVIIDVVARTGRLDGSMNASRAIFDRNATAIERSANRMSASIVRSSNQAGQSMAAASQRSRLLGFQIADIGTQLASGTSPFIVLAQQAPQVANALDGTRGAVGKIAAALSGPFGAAGLAAASILGVLISRMMEAKSESVDLGKQLETAADGADAFGDAQSLLGKLVDLTTGKLRTQNDVLKATIRLQAILAQEQARVARENARTVINREAGRSVGGFGIIAPGGTSPGQVSPVRLVSPELRSLSDQVLAGKLGIDPALKQLEALGKAGKVAKDAIGDLRTQFVEFGQAQQKDAAARAILDFLDGKGLDPRLRQQGRSSKKRDRAGADVEAQFDRLLSGLQSEQLGLQQSLTTDLRERARLEHEQIELAKGQALREVADDTDLNAARRRQLGALIERNAEIRHTNVNWKLDDDLVAEEAALAKAQLENRATLLAGDLDAARTQAERRRIQLAILDAEIELQRAALEAVETAHDSTEAQKQIARARLAQLPAEREQRRGAIERGTTGPLGQYLSEIPRDLEEMNEAYQMVAADGLRQLNDGLAEAIMNSRSLADVFSNVADQIIADLLRIAIQQAVIKPLGEALTGGGGLVGVIGGMLGFASGGYTGNQPTNKVAGVVHGREFVMNATATKRIGVENLQALNAGMAPLIAMRAAAPRQATTKVYNISVSADHSVTPAGFARGLAAQILQEAKRMDAQASAATLSSVPSVLAKHDRYDG